MLTPESFLAPDGELEPGTWPDTEAGGNTLTRLEKWLEAGALLVASLPDSTHDTALAAYVYGKAFRAIADRLGATPARAEQHGLGHTISTGQLQYWTQRALQQEAIFDRLTSTPAEVTETTIFRVPGTTSTPNTFVW